MLFSAEPPDLVQVCPVLKVAEGLHQILPTLLGQLNFQADPKRLLRARSFEEKLRVADLALMRPLALPEDALRDVAADQGMLLQDDPGLGAGTAMVEDERQEILRLEAAHEPQLAVGLEQANCHVPGNGTPNGPT